MPPQFSDRERWAFIARSVVSLVLVAACLMVILKGDYPDAVPKMGYWDNWCHSPL